MYENEKDILREKRLKRIKELQTIERLNKLCAEVFIL
jgi:hypothetical protein